MQLYIFDVNNADCTLAVSPNGYSAMIDCGCNTEKECPVDIIVNNKSLFGLKEFAGHDLTLLHITHPDEDHIKNAKKVKEKLPPYILCRRQVKEYPITEKINDEYKYYLDSQYTYPVNSTPDRGWKSREFQIDMDELKSNENLSGSLRNNSSMIKLIECYGKRILFGGDLEKEGRDWFCQNNQDFVDTMSQGVDILIAPHHGHKSGFSKSLFDLTGNVKVVIHSKASESGIDGTDVSSQYSEVSNGIEYTNLGDKSLYFGKVLTTRSNGFIMIDIKKSGAIKICTEKASPNHEKI